MSLKNQPIAKVQWINPEKLRANDYNPNKVFPPELALIRQSLLEDGWTMPLVVRPDFEIVDGFHRWGLACRDREVRALTGGLVPVVFLAKGKSRADQMLSTVRHNRARGQHGILKMSKIVRDLQAAWLKHPDREKRLGMEPEEIERLSDLRGSPDNAGQESFGKGWVPDTAGRAAKKKAKK